MKRSYYLFNPGRLSRKDNSLKFIAVDEQGKEQKPKYLPVEQVEELYAFGSLDANSSLYNFLGKNQIAVHFFDYYENYSGSFMPKESLLSGKLLLAQARTYENPFKRLQLAKLILEGAVHHILRNLRYYDKRGKDLDPMIQEISSLWVLAQNAKNIEELMGFEGNIRRYYYEGFELMINNFSMSGRSYRPPQNEVNALISFGNMMCYSQCLKAVHQTQLNPTISFLHSPGERRFSFCLDLAEIFKPLMVDKVIFKVLNKKMIQSDDFETSLNRIVLKESAKKKFVEAFELLLQDTILHRKLRKSVSYKHLIKLECYKIVKHILNIEQYRPLKAWW